MVERVAKVLPQLQFTVMSSYFGCISAFMALSAFNYIGQPPIIAQYVVPDKPFQQRLLASSVFLNHGQLSNLSGRID